MEVLEEEAVAVSLLGAEEGLVEDEAAVEEGEPHAQH